VSFPLNPQNPNGQPQGIPPASIYDPFGRVTPPTNDPAYQPPRDPLRDPDAKARATVIHREIPLTTIQTGWQVGDVRQALEALTIGNFDLPAQLVDAVIGDDRVHSCLGQRTGGLLSRPVKFSLPRRYRDDPQAKKCLRAFRQAWESSIAESTLAELQRGGVLLGFSISQLIWDTSGQYWIPYLLPFHSRYTYYNFMVRAYVALTMDGQVPVTPGDGHWILHAPHGEYRAWMQGAIRAIAQPWLGKQYAQRDYLRYSERHGFPTVKALIPAADQTGHEGFKAQLTTLGQESAITLPQGVDKGSSYDLDYLEASDQAWQGFPTLIELCEKQITLALLHQNLTTEIKEGSFAAARVHADVRQSALEADARALSDTIYKQIARPFAAFNFDNADLAPRIDWDVRPFEDSAAAAKTFLDFANSTQQLLKAGWKLNDIAAMANAFGLPLELGRPEAVTPVQVEAATAAGDERE